METPLAPVEIFYSCSDSQRDAPLLELLERHLSTLKQNSMITTWHKRQIVAGSDWQRELDYHLKTASLILLLISPDFLASGYQYGVELQLAMQRHDNHEARVIPIVVRPCDWEGAPFARLQVIPRNGKAITSWRNRDEAFVDVAKEIRAALETMQELLLSISPTTLPKIWQIPYPRNAVFTGRDHQLSALAQALDAEHSITLSQPQAISGLGGIGKTQLAVEYAYHFAQRYQAVFWVDAETQGSIISGYAELSKLLNLREKDEKDQRLMIKAVQQWLQKHTNWLLILDNADDLSLIQPFLPPVISGHIILTTRAQATGRFAHHIEIGTLTLDDGARLLLRRAKVLSAQGFLEDAAEQDVVLACQISEELGGLPLALDQAGAYIEEKGCNLMDYQRLYRARRTDLLRTRGEFGYDHPKPIATTWSLSFEQVEQQNPAAADLLRLCAFLASDAIPLELLTAGAKECGDVLAPVITDAYLLDMAIATLRAYSLITRDPQARTLSIHRLVQAVLRDNMSVEIQQQWMLRVVLAIEAAFPESPDIANWPVLERLLPHALICTIWIEQSPLTMLEAARLLNQIGYYLKERVRYEEARPMYEHALTICEQHLGVSHPQTAQTLNNLAELYSAEGKYESAEPLYERALTICEQHLGATHSQTAASLNNLAYLYQVQEKYAEAELLYQRTLAICERQLGATHPHTAASLNNLARLYRTQGKYEEAELLYRCALAICEQALGAVHPHTAISLNNLADLYQAQGRYEDAESLYQRALAICEQALGAVHPHTAISLNNLAGLYQAQGRYEGIESLYQRAMAICKPVLGRAHPDTQTILKNYVSLLRIMGREADAKQLEAEP